MSDTSAVDLDLVMDNILKTEKRLLSASSQDEAIKNCIAGADLCMSGLKISDDPLKKTFFRRHCKALLDEAERIKAASCWKLNPGLIYSLGASELIQKPGRPATQPSVDCKQPPGELASCVDSRWLKHPKPQQARRCQPFEHRLLQDSSHLRGSVFPPFVEPPHPSDFELRDADNKFKDDEHIALSPAQKNILDGWKRAAEALPPFRFSTPPEQKTKGPTMTATGIPDLIQDVTTDCSVVASICSAVAREQALARKIISDIIYPYDTERRQPAISENGKYMLNLNFNGCKRQVTIDDRLPVSKTSRLLHVIDRQNPSLLWPALIEKAYLKVRGGYDFPGSNSNTDLYILTGWLPEQASLQGPSLDPDALWDECFKAFSEGDVLVTVGTGKISEDSEKKLGLVSEHSYAVMDMEQTPMNERMLFLKNPWRDGSVWIGRGSNSRRNLKEWGSRKVGKQNGSFWIEFSVMAQNFQFMYLNWNPRLWTYRSDLHFSWDLQSRPEKTAPTPHISFVGLNPHFKLDTSGESLVWVLLCRHFKGMHQVGDTNNDLNGFIGLACFGGETDLQVHFLEDAVERGPLLQCPQVLLKLDVRQWDEVSIVPVEHNLTRSRHTFTLTLFGHRPPRVEMVQQWTHVARLDGRWTSASAGGSTNSQAYTTNPQYSLSLSQRTRLMLLLEPHENAANVNVAILHGNGERLEEVHRRDVVASSGDYRGGTAAVYVPELAKGTYIVICSTFEKGQEGQFKVTANSSLPCQLEALIGENAGRIAKRLERAEFPIGSCKLAASVFPRRLARARATARAMPMGYRSGIHDKFGLSSKSDAPIPTAERPSPIRISIELGRGPDKQILVTSAHGSFRDNEGGTRTPEIDVSPEMLRAAEMWLVLERLTMKPMEELFSVELLLDIPEAVAVGAWQSWH